MVTNRNYVFDDNPGKALIKLAWPMLVGMLALTIFSVVDTWYVSRLGTLELAAMSFTFPVVMLLNGVTLGIGVGLTSVVSNKIGEKAIEEVRCYTRDGLGLAMLIVVIFTVAGLLTIKPLFRAMGATEEILPLVSDYMTIWYFGAAAVVIPMVGNGAIRGTGDTVTPMWIMTIAAILNIILDPLLIFGIGPFPRMELEGAALATVIARAGTMVASLYVLGIRDKLINPRIPKLREMFKHWRDVMEVGIYAAIIHLLVPLSSGLLTRLVASYGPEAVAAFGAGTRIEMFAAMIPIAMASGMMVYTGQHWGAKKYDRLIIGINRAQQFVIIAGAFIYLLITTTASPLARLFSSEVTVIEPLVFYLRVALAGLMLESLSSVGGSVFNGIRRPKTAFIIFFFRFILLLLPLAWIGGLLAGVKGLFVGFFAAKVITGFVAWRFLSGFKKEVVGLASESN